MCTDRPDNYHPEGIGFVRLSKFPWTIKTDRIKFKALINLPSQVQTHSFEKFDLGCSESSAKVVYMKIFSQ